MPHIIINGSDQKRQVRLIDVHIEIDFNYNKIAPHRMTEIMDYLEDKISNVVLNYFDSVDTDQLSNREFNKLKG